MSFILDPFVTINASNQAYIFMRAVHPFVRRTYVSPSPDIGSRVAIPELKNDEMGGQKHIELTMPDYVLEDNYVKVLEGEELTFPEILPMLMFEQDDFAQARRNNWEDGPYIWWDLKEGMFMQSNRFDPPTVFPGPYQITDDDFAATDWVLVNPNDAPT
jgi:hypothetical protein